MLHGLLTFSVPTITPNELKKLQATRPLLLLDAREAKEYKVSHIAGALNVGYDHFDPAATDKLLAKAATDPRYSKNATVVVYCSVGYRSEKIGEKLGAMGYTHVYNLYGSIFEWVNEGNAVVDAKGKPTPYVHAYNPAWGVWLTKGKKTYQNP